MHGGAPSALLAHAIDDVEGGEGMLIARLTVEFLAGVPLGRVAVAARVAKPGQRFQLLEATLDVGERRVLSARAVRLRRADEPGGEAAPPPSAEPLPPPDAGEPLPRFVDVPGEIFYPDAMEIRQVRGTLGSGAVGAWFRLREDVVPGRAPTPMARAASAADFTNGLSWILPWDEWTFVNTELTVHLLREPEGEWIGLDARSAISGEGTGLATGVLHDLRGPVGACAQSLFVARR